MKLTPFIYIITLFFFFEISAQEKLTLPNGSFYHATNSWDFLCERYALSGQTNIQIAKTDKGGILKITADTTSKDFYIGGTTYVYLSDFTAIACTDKNLREKTENSTVAYYYFTPAEMNRLKKNDILSIRFNIKGDKNAFSSQIGNFTALNKKSYFGTFGNEQKNIFETAAEIALLYQ